VPYIDANGVHTYYETEGEGEPLVLLHGGTAPIETWAAQRPALAAKYTVYLPERRAHGRTADVDGPITYEIMADDTIAFMDALGISNAYLVGWSDGANTGMLVALHRPDLVRTLVSIGGNFHYDGLGAGLVAFAQTMTSETHAPALRALYETSSPEARSTSASCSRRSSRCGSPAPR
jgi:pimeloyl-ACP methyl ester carboxylesterase